MSSQLPAGPFSCQPNFLQSSLGIQGGCGALDLEGTGGALNCSFRGQKGNATPLAIGNEIRKSPRSNYLLRSDPEPDFDHSTRHMAGLMEQILVLGRVEAGTPAELTITHEGANAVFTVRDHGVGIPEADLPKLFQAFHRAPNVGDTPGTGLGLVIVKRCVELHGGSIAVDSKLGEGTTFTVVLPLFPST